MRIGPFTIQRTARTGRRQYDAARVSRLTSDWVFSHQSADREIRGGLVKIRARARDLERNSDYARRYLALVESNIVGKAGFSLRLAVPDPLAANGAELVEGFNSWLNRADVSGQHDSPGLQRLTVRSAARDGEALAMLRRGRNFPDGLGVRVIESDFLSVDTQSERDESYMGVKLDANGAPFTYTLYDKHPGDYSAHTATREHPASDVIHVFRAERPGQRRAVSWMASAMLPMRMLAGYQEAELVAARMAACQMGFYKVAPGNDFGGDGEDAQGNPVTDAAPGMFERLPPGWDFQQYTPQHPTTQYAEFVKSIIREIAAGLGVSYSALANDGSDANYSSMREMSILERENWMVLQNWFARSFMSRLWREWITSVDLLGKYKFDLEPYRAADRWTGKSWPWVDPAKDARAREMDVAMRLTAPSILAAEQGMDYAAICKQAAKDEAMRARETADAMEAAGVAPVEPEEPKNG